MTTTTTAPAVQPTTGSTHKPRMRHIVELDATGRPLDKCLCGYLWDRVMMTTAAGSEVCKECVEEAQRRSL